MTLRGIILASLFGFSPLVYAQAQFGEQRSIAGTIPRARSSVVEQQARIVSESMSDPILVRQGTANPTSVQQATIAPQPGIKPVAPQAQVGSVTPPSVPQAGAAPHAPTISTGQAQVLGSYPAMPSVTMPTPHAGVVAQPMSMPAGDCAACASNPCDECTAAPKSCSLLNDMLSKNSFWSNSGLTANGFISMGYTINPHNPNNRMNGPVTWFDRANDFQVNQTYLSISKSIDTEKDELQFGGSLDFLYGSDAVFTQALGLDQDIVTDSPLYRLAIPQAYVDVYLPKAKTTLRAGHFYTIMGYEVVKTTDNFFASIPYTFAYGVPFTHTGLLAITKLGCEGNVTMTNGVVRGWDSWYDNNNALSYLGGVTWNVNDKVTATFNVIAGAEQDEPNLPFQGIIDTPGSTVNRAMYTAWIRAKLSDKLTWILHHDHAVQDAALNAPAAEWYSVVNYLQYDVNDKLAIGARAEWFRDDDGVRVGIARFTSNLGPQVNDVRIPAAQRAAFGNGLAGANYYALSLAANYKANTCLTIRPELRWDFQDRDDAGTTRAYSDSSKVNQFLAMMNVIVKF